MLHHLIIAMIVSIVSVLLLHKHSSRQSPSPKADSPNRAAGVFGLGRRAPISALVLLLASAVAAPALAAPTALARVSDDNSTWGTSVTVQQGATVYLDHTESRLGEGQTINNTDEFAWTASPSTGVTITQDNVLGPSTFTAPNTSTNLEITLTLTVTDTDDSTTATDTVTVTVTRSNTPPTASATATPNPVEAGGTVMLDGSGSTDPGDTLTYAWKQVADTAGTALGTATVTWVAGENDVSASFTAPGTAQTLYIQLTVTDTALATGTTVVTVTVNPPVNTAPTAVAAATPARVEPLKNVTLDGSGSTDTPGDTLSYSWKEVDSGGADIANPLVARADSDNPAKAVVFISRTLPAGTTLYFELTVTDQGGATSTDTVEIEILNAAPVAGATANQHVMAGSEVSLQGSFSDANGDSVTYLWRQVDKAFKPVATETVTLTNPDQATATFTAPDITVTLWFEFQVTEKDITPALDNSAYVAVVVDGPNVAPVADGGGDQLVYAGDEVLLDGSATTNPDIFERLNYFWEEVDINGDPVISDLLITPLRSHPSRAVFIAPKENTVLHFKLTVSDNEGLSSTDTVLIRVRIARDEPVIASIGGKQGLALAGSINNALSERVEDIEVGGGASFRPGNGFALPLSGVPGSPGSVGFWARVNNSTPSDATEALTWDGENTTTIFGFDWLSSEEGMVGIMFATLEGSFDYTDATLGTGILESELTTQTPYMGMIQKSGLRVWGAVGSGTGDLTMTFNGVSSNAGVDVRNALVGVGQTIETGSGIEVDVKGEFSAVVLDVEETSDSRLGATSISASQFRLTGVGSLPLYFASGAEFVPALELAVRTDDGDSENGTGVEIGLKLKYVSGKGRFSMAGNFRSMVSTLNDYEENGSQFVILFEAGSDGRGWAFALEPSYGQTESGTDRLWSEDLTALASGQAAKQAHLGAEMSYGVELPSRHGVLLSPYSRMRQDEAGQNQLRYGMRLSFGESFRLAMSSLNRYGIDGNRDRQTHLTGELRF